MRSSSGFSGSGRQGGAWGALFAVRRGACFACSCFELVPLLLFPLGALRASALSPPPGDGMKARAIPGGSQSAGCSLMLFTEHGFSAPRGRSTSQTSVATRERWHAPPESRICRRRQQKYSCAGGSGSGRHLVWRPPLLLFPRASASSAQSSSPFTLNKLECSKQAKSGVKAGERLA